MPALEFDKPDAGDDTCRMPVQRPAAVPLPLLLGFALFVVGLGWVVTASLTRREAPVCAPSPPARARASNWMEVGDTLTLDAADESRLRYASLTLGRALEDSVGWELAARRHRIVAAGEVADLGPVAFASALQPADTAFQRSMPDDDASPAMRRWYDYSIVTHLLETKAHVYALRTRQGRTWKVQVLSYYCPGLRAGCLTIRYAPLADP